MSKKLVPDDPVGKNLQKLENITVSSFRRCSEDVGGNEISVKVYGGPKQSSIQAEYKKVCGCITFPSYLHGEPVSIDSHGQCLWLHVGENCKGERSRLSEIKTIGDVQQMYTDTVWRPVNDVKSFEPCELPISCYE